MADVVIPESVGGIATFLRPERDEIIRAMDTKAAAEGFPTVGPEVGSWLELLVEITDARRVFEFGSGFGYSAYWFARGLGPEGEVVLTEIDADELEDAREYFAQAGWTDRARFEHGDAIDTVREYDGPFDVVLIDNEKERYVEAFEAVKGKLRPGSIVLADNAVTAGDVVNRDEVVALLSGEAIDATYGSQGIVEYLRHVRSAPGCHSSLLPLGQGVAVTRIGSTAVIDGA